MTYKDLIVWQKADAFAHQVYLKTRSFPKDELFGITSQIRRAALSVPTNIVEGYARKGDKELARFLNIAIGSLAETEYLLGFANRLGYIDTTDFKELETLKDDVSKALWSFYKKVVSA
jgi:four helix bundle protein